MLNANNKMQLTTRVRIVKSTDFRIFNKREKKMFPTLFGFETRLDPVSVQILSPADNQIVNNFACCWDCAVQGKLNTFLSFLLCDKQLWCCVGSALDVLKQERMGSTGLVLNSDECCSLSVWTAVLPP